MRVILLLVCITFAGCVESNAERLNLEAAALEDLEPSHGLRLSVEDCWASTAFMVWPEGYGPAVQPTGWVEMGGIIDDYKINIWQCKTVKAGPLEAGNATIIVGVQHQYVPPSSCLTGSTVINPIDAIGIDHPDMASYLANELQMPATYIIMQANPIIEGNSIKEFSWQHQTEYVSNQRLTISPGVNQIAGIFDTWEFVWAADGLLGTWNADVLQGPGQRIDTISQGAVQAPFAHPHAVPYAGTGSNYELSHVDGSVRLRPLDECS